MTSASRSTPALPTFLAAQPPAAAVGLKPFVKMHGLRNHFVIFDRRNDAFALPAAAIIRLCDPYEGLAADQVITIEQPTAAGAAAGAFARMGIFNTDGQESGACGNATRCVARLLFDETGHSALVLETLGGLLACRDAGGTAVSVDMAPITQNWQAFPLAREVDMDRLPVAHGHLQGGMALHIGGPHALFFVDDLDAVDVAAEANVIQNDPLFPEKTNVGVAQVLGKSHLRLVVWERPGMLTQACGTGACVAAFGAVRRGLVEGPRITVSLPGGDLQIALDGAQATMTGPTAFCACGYAAV